MNLKTLAAFKQKDEEEEEDSHEVKEKSEGQKVTFPSRLKGLQDWQSAQDVNQLQELSR